MPFFNQFKREVSGAHRAVLESPCVVFKPTGLPFLRGRIAFGSPSLPFRLAKGLPLRAKRAASAPQKLCFQKTKKQPYPVIYLVMSRISTNFAALSLIH
ncbi:hypothetical protein C3V39_08610 [Prevotella sp. oral taxon 820]|nr:hypothetical protein C3V39_08610 [Prevotella sp. oral taxon 820]